MSLIACFVSQPPQILIPCDSETNTIDSSNHLLIAVITMINLWGHWMLHHLKPKSHHQYERKREVRERVPLLPFDLNTLKATKMPLNPDILII